MGDAAHCHSAAGAYGLNTGIMDSHNLVWKLALDVYGIAKPSLLASYETERRQIALRIVEGSSQFLRFVCNKPGSCTFATQLPCQDYGDFKAPVFIPSSTDENDVDRTKLFLLGMHKHTLDF